MLLFSFTVVAEDNHGLQFNGSNVSMTQEVTKAHFSGLDWEYGGHRILDGQWSFQQGHDCVGKINKNYNSPT